MSHDPIILDVFASGILRIGTAEYKCAIGPSGVTRNKKEGDGATPAGRFPLRSVMYRPDRVETPETSLPVRSISESDGWCDDPGHSDYNRLVVRPHPSSHEALWRDDHVYDVIVEIGYNDDPPAPGQGSAIFMHVARADYTPTEGCVALALSDLLSVLRQCDTKTLLRINPAD